MLLKMNTIVEASSDVLVGGGILKNTTRKERCSTSEMPPKLCMRDTMPRGDASKNNLRRQDH